MYKEIELTSKTKRVFALYPLLKEVWQDNLETPVFPSYTPHEVCRYQGGNLFLPIQRLVDGELVEHQPFDDDDDSYALLTLADDIPVTLSVGEQVIFDHSHLVDISQFKMTAYETQLAEVEVQLEKALALQEGV
jgi:hypothetical protein